MIEDMSKGSGGTRSTNSKSAHSSGEGSIRAAISEFNSIKLDSAQAFGAKSKAMTNALNKISSGSQVDLSSKSALGNETKQSFVKNGSGNFVQKHVADSGMLDNAFEQWTPGNIASTFLDTTMSVKKYKK